MQCTVCNTLIKAINLCSTQIKTKMVYLSHLKSKATKIYICFVWYKVQKRAHVKLKLKLKNRKKKKNKFPYLKIIFGTPGKT